MNLWKAGEEVTDIARELILAHRPELADVNIMYLFREKATRRGTKFVLGTARKCSEREQLVHTPPDFPAVVFVIELAADAWANLSEGQKRAVIHHELNHCGFEKKEDGSLVPSNIPHDVEEFASVIETHGLYMRDIENFVNRALTAVNSGGSGVESSPDV